MVAGMVLDPTVKNAYYVDGRLMVVAELAVHGRSQLAGKTVQEMPPCNMVSLSRNGSCALFPRWDTVVEIGDTVVLQTTAENLEELHRLNQEKELLI